MQETTAGQLYLDSPAIDPGTGQLAIGGVAAPPVAAPVTFQRDAAETAAREQLAALVVEHQEQDEPCAATCEHVPPVEHEADSEPAPERTKPQKRAYACGSCGRKLKPKEWIYSTFTGARYCVPGEGCQTRAAIAARDRRYAKRAAERARKED